MGKTTIQVSEQTLVRIKNLKKFERQSYDEVLNGVIDEVEEEVLSEEEIREIQQALEEVKQGKVYQIERVAKEIGVRLR